MITRIADEKHFNVIVKVERTIVEFYEVDIPAVSVDDAEALTKNYYLDGHLIAENEPFTTDYTDNQLVGIYVKPQGE